MSQHYIPMETAQGGSPYSEAFLPTIENQLAVAEPPPWAEPQQQDFADETTEFAPMEIGPQYADETTEFAPMEIGPSEEVMEMPPDHLMDHPGEAPAPPWRQKQAASASYRGTGPYREADPRVAPAPPQMQDVANLAQESFAQRMQGIDAQDLTKNLAIGDDLSSLQILR